jgi:hypothetical protein
MAKREGKHINIVVSDEEYQTMKLAAVVEKSDHLKAWATSTLLKASQATVQKFKEQTGRDDHG